MTPRRWVVVLALGLATTGARADDAGPSRPAESTDDGPSSPWARGEPRWFVAGELAAGAVVRNLVQAGYGKPHRLWAGLELMALSTTEVGSLGVAARARLLVVDVHAGVRRSHAYAHGFLQPAARHGSEALTVRTGERADYTAVDLSVEGGAPVPRGYVLVTAAATRTSGVPEGVHLYEEHLRAVVAPGWSGAGRLGYLLALGTRWRLHAGPLAEVVFHGRDTTRLWRAGAVVKLALTPRLDVVLIGTTPVRGPDQLGFYPGLWGTGVLRYRWAR